MIYLYCFFETVKQCHIGPTPVDLLAVENGELEVLRLSLEPDRGLGPDIKVEAAKPDGSWVPVDEAELATSHGQSWHE